MLTSANAFAPGLPACARAKAALNADRRGDRAQGLDQDLERVAAEQRLFRGGRRRQDQQRADYRRDVRPCTARIRPVLEPARQCQRRGGKDQRAAADREPGQQLARGARRPREPQRARPPAIDPAEQQPAGPQSGRERRDTLPYQRARAASRPAVQRRQRREHEEERREQQEEQQDPPRRAEPTLADEQTP